MEKYNYRTIEKKWQKHWEETKCFQASDDQSLEKMYLLIEFPFPSGQGLHVGHPRPYTALDIIARKHRMLGKNVLYPMGFDSFGLPTENYAIANKIHPAIVTDNNIKNMKSQLKSLGFSFDWDREIRTSDPEYYKWTQWIFLKLFEKNLAYKTQMNINYCPSCKVSLANEEVIAGACERCHTPVIRKQKDQWMLRITDYAERLVKDLDDLNFIERVKVQQKNWIGRSEGARIFFPVKDTDQKLEVFTTRPDTIYGATYMVVAPEHPIIWENKERIHNIDEVEAYRTKAKFKSDFERTKLMKEKTGVALDGLVAINPISNEEIIIFVSDYVMMDYGTGAIMAVPAHDERDYEFAKVFDLPVVEVISGGDIKKEAYSGNGTLINSPLIDGLSVEDAKKKMIDIIEERKLGERTIQYKLRDWVFSRQRYWGEPIPIVHCEKCGMVPLDEKDLPLTLPEVDNYEPSDDGSSPLAKIDEWMHTTCPKCGGPALRESDTMPQWAGSSWYFLRYLDPHNHQALASKDKIDHWMQVDWYNGGMEHTTLHLLYSRFWYKFLYDIGVVPQSEPYAKRTSHGYILGSDGEKMSKSRGNIVNPDDIIKNFGADTLRLYEMFIGDFEKAVTWSDDGVRGSKKFLDRVWYVYDMLNDETGFSKELVIPINQTIKKVSEDYDNLKANTAIAEMMSLVNEYYKKGSVSRDEYEVLLTLLNPVAPHITEELFERLGNEKKIYESSWPSYNEKYLHYDEVEIPVQFNGRVRYKVSVARDANDQAVLEAVKADEKWEHYSKDQDVKKMIVIKNKLVSVVLK